MARTCHLYPSERDRRKRIDGIAIRVIEYVLPQGLNSEPLYRLHTLLDDQGAPAQDLAQLYHERWEVELVFDELKTHLSHRQSASCAVKRQSWYSQEFYGWVMAHYAVRWLMYQGATQADIPEGTVSFTATVQLVRRTLPQSGALHPWAPKNMVSAAG